MNMNEYPVYYVFLKKLMLYSERQKYGINSLKMKQIFFSKKSLDRSILVYKNTYFSTKENSKQSFVFEL
jgi:hypothetical protein